MKFRAMELEMFDEENSISHDILTPRMVKRSVNPLATYLVISWVRMPSEKQGQAARKIQSSVSWNT